MCQKNHYTRRAATVLLAVIAALFVFGAMRANAQIAQGGDYKLEQAVIGSGGGTTSSGGAGNVYKIESVIGEPIAGTTSSSPPYSVKGGFFAANALAPTAAQVSISGRVLTTTGSGLRNARVTLTGADGSSRTIMTGKSGNFRFDDAQAGETYMISVHAKRYVFQPQIVTANEEVTGLIFSAFSQSGEGLENPL